MFKKMLIFQGEIMIKHKDHFHGSDLEKIEQIYGIKKEPSSVRIFFFITFAK